MAVGLLIAAAGMASSATLARGFAGYFQVLMDWPEAQLIIALVAALGLIAGWGIKSSVRIAAALTIIEAGGLIMIVVAAGDNLQKIPEQLPEMLLLTGNTSMPGLLLGAFLGFFAFIGFEDMVNVAEEVERPERNLPLGIFIALCVSTVIYLLVVLAALTSVPMEELAASKAPLALVFQHATGRSPIIISVIGMLAVVNGALVQIIMAARVIYGMSANGWLPRALGAVNSHTRTPLTATALVVLIIVLLAVCFPLVHLAGATSFLVLGVFALVNLALVALKRRQRSVSGILPCPMWVPIAGASASLGLLVAQLLH
jgi:amino acid transporter